MILKLKENRQQTDTPIKHDPNVCDDYFCKVCGELWRVAVLQALERSQRRKAIERATFATTNR